MEKNAKIYIAGHRGMVGSAILRKLKSAGYSNLIFKTSNELDLTDQKKVKQFFEKEKPDYVFIAAAKVGGIIANNTLRGDFIYRNLMIQNNVIHYSYLNNVKKLVFLGSSCIYPKFAAQPIKEEYLLSHYLEHTNEPYAIAKIAGLKLCESYNKQYGTNFISVMPSNLYGPNDNFNLRESHVLTALLRKMHLGKCLETENWDCIRKDLNKRPIDNVDGKNDRKEIFNILSKNGIKIIEEKGKIKNVTIEVWGTGKPFREFLHVNDLADAVIYIMNHYDLKKNIFMKAGEIKDQLTYVNIGSGTDISIKGLADKIKEIIGFIGNLEYNHTKPDGTPRKLLDVTRLNNLGWKYKIDLNRGVKNTYEWYIS